MAGSICRMYHSTSLHLSLYHIRVGGATTASTAPRCPQGEEASSRALSTMYATFSEGWSGNTHWLCSIYPKLKYVVVVQRGVMSVHCMPGCLSSIHLLGRLATLTSAAPVVRLFWEPSAKRALCGLEGHGRILEADTVMTDAMNVRPNREETNRRCEKRSVRNEGVIMLFF